MKKMTSKIMVMAVLMAGLLFAGAQSTAAQEVCKTVDKLKEPQKSLYRNQQTAEEIEARDCWTRKVKSGERELENAYLSLADLTGADMKHVNLKGAWLRLTDLTGVDLTGANLTKANFYAATLISADFSYGNLGAANFNMADLTNAKWTGVTLNGAKANRRYTKGIDFNWWISEGGTLSQN